MKYKFKVGDRVRIISNNDSSKYDEHIGKEDVISKLNESFGYQYLLKEIDCFWEEEGLELVQSIEPNQSIRQINGYTLDNLIITSKTKEEWDKVLDKLEDERITFENGEEAINAKDWFYRQNNGYSINLKEGYIDGHCWYDCYKLGSDYNNHIYITAKEFLNELIETPNPFGSFYGDKDSNLKKVEDKKIINNKTNIMSNILNKVKNLTLSKDDKLLREYGFQNNCGDFTEEARQVVLEKLVADNKEYLIEVAKKLEKEDKE